MPASLSVFLNVHDVQKSIAFYEALGFTVDNKHENKDGMLWWADLKMGDAEIGLGAIESNDDPEYRAWVATPLGAGVILYVSVEDVDAVHEKARAAGAEIEYAPTDRSYGRVFGCVDPDGYSLAFIKE